MAGKMSFWTIRIGPQLICNVYIIYNVCRVIENDPHLGAFWDGDIPTWKSQSILSELASLKTAPRLSQVIHPGPIGIPLDSEALESRGHPRAVTKMSPQWQTPFASQASSLKHEIKKKQTTSDNHDIIRWSDMCCLHHHSRWSPSLCWANPGWYPVAIHHHAGGSGSTARHVWQRVNS